MPFLFVFQAYTQQILIGQADGCQCTQFTKVFALLVYHCYRYGLKDMPSIGRRAHVTDAQETVLVRKPLSSRGRNN